MRKSDENMKKTQKIMKSEKIMKARPNYVRFTYKKCSLSIQLTTTYATTKNIYFQVKKYNQSKNSIVILSIAILTAMLTQHFNRTLLIMKICNQTIITLNTKQRSHFFKPLLK